MAYAGIQTMLLAYKMRRSDKQFELSQIAHQLEVATRDSSSINELYDAKKADAAEQYGKDSVEYEDAVDDLDKKMNLKLADIAKWENELGQDKSNCETEIAQLDGYITSWTSALQQGVQKAHTYGAQNG